MNVGIIQARMGSSRLPGKMMMPLDGVPTLTHVVRRVHQADSLDETIVATSEKKQDDILALYAERAGARVFRGSETDVLGRMYAAAERFVPDTVVRLTGDCPLLPPDCIDIAVDAIQHTDAEYASTVLDRTFPRGFGTEAFTFDSFSRVESVSDEPYQREHVTPHYRENPSDFDAKNITSDEIFDDDQYRGRVELRLTLDEAPDYELIRRIYDGVQYDRILNVRDAIDYVDREGIADLNEEVEQVTLDELK